MAVVSRGVGAGGLAAVLCLMAGAALAQTNISAQNRGPYIGLGVGPNFQESSRVRGGGADATANYDTGFVGLGSLGYAFGNGLRLEVEPGYRRNELDTIGGVTAHGHVTMETLMANAIMDIPFRVPGNLPILEDMLPHIGVGAGVAHVMNNSLPYNGLTVTRNDTVPAFQAIAGLEYAITPAFKAGIDYRYLLAHNVNGFRTAETGARVSAGDMNNHSILLTLRYEFGVPHRPPVQPAAAAAVAAPPAQPAPPPPPQPRNYVVYFDLNRATLTPTAREVVRQAATNAQRDRVTRITVTGYTDTTGSARYNQNLSERRAAAVQAELVANGVPADQIVTAGQGENDLAVPTANNVNEPRNRRVVILEQAPGL